MDEVELAQYESGASLEEAGCGRDRGDAWFRGESRHDTARVRERVSSQTRLCGDGEGDGQVRL